MTLRKYIGYGAIALFSLAEGAYEGVYDAPGILKPVLIIGFPIVSGMIGAKAELEEVFDKPPEKTADGFKYVINLDSGIIKGAGLSALCEAAGFGLAKLAKAFS